MAPSLMLTNKRIGFDVRPVMALYSGIGQYVRQLFPAMARLKEPVQWIAYAAPEVHMHVDARDFMDSVSWRIPPPNGIRRWMQPSSDSLDVFHGTNFKAPNYGQKKPSLPFMIYGWIGFQSILKSCLVRVCLPGRLVEERLEQKKLLRCQNFPSRKFMKFLVFP